jgi:hypothetical protein
MTWRLLPDVAQSPTRVLVCGGMLVGCFLEDGGGKGGGEPSTGNGGDSGAVWGTGHVHLEVEGGVTGEIVDPDGGEGPAFFTGSGQLEQGIVSISEGLGGDFLDVSLLSVEPGISTGATCRDFDHLELSTGGCHWVSVGSGSLNMGDGTTFSAIDWTATEGTLQVDELRAEDDEQGWISFHFSFNLTDGNRTALLEGEVVDAWLSR